METRVTAPAYPVPAAIVITIVCLLNPVHDTDLFWQVSFGERILANRGPLFTEPFYPDAIGRPIVPIYGLAQVGDAIVVRIGGFELLKLLDALIWATAFTMPAWVAGRRFGVSGTLAALWGFFPASTFTMLRPQSFALLGAGLLVALLLSRVSNRGRLILGLAVMVLWQNAHPSVLIAAFILLPFVVIGWWRRMAPVAETLLLLMVPVAMIATPAGTDVLTLMTINTDRVALFGVNEWMPIFHPSNRGVITRTVIGLMLNVLLIVSVVVRFPTFGVRIQNHALIFGGMALGFLLMTVLSHRIVLFFGVISVPLAMLIPRRPPRPAGRMGWPLLALVVVIVSWIGLKTRRLPLWNSWFPVDAALALKAHQPNGPVFVTTEWGGLVSYHGMSPLMDGRYFARTHEECERYLAIIRGEAPIDSGAVACFLTPDYETLKQRMDVDPAWRVLFRDDHAIVYVRRN